SVCAYDRLDLRPLLQLVIPLRCLTLLCSFLFFFFLLRLPPGPTPFPYTTLFRSVDDLLRPPQHVRVLIENPRPRCQDLFPRLTEREHQPQLVEQLRPLREVVQQVLGFLKRVPLREQVHVVEGCDPVPRPATRR